MDANPDPPEEVPFVSMPELFHSDETGAPFGECVACGSDLTEDGTGYLIEKGFVRGETAFEYAICFACYHKVSEGISEASRRRVMHYFGERVDLDQRRQRFQSSQPDRWRERLSTCLLSGKPLGDEYQIFGQCDGGDLLLADLPYAICGEELENLAQILSKETRKQIDGFVDDFLGVPGDGLKLPVPL